MFNLVAATDEFFTRKQLYLPRQQSWYPSEASVAWVDAHDISRVSGNCLRKSYLRYTGIYMGEEVDAYTQWIFALGKAVEEILVKQWQCMGIWEANNIKFYNRDYNLSGEIDVILKEPDTKTPFIVEVKSFAGYYATKEIIGSKKGGEGHPKTSQLLQTLIYLYECKHLFPYAKMIYYARDSGSRREFNISLEQELLPDGQVLTRPVVDGIMDFRFTLEDVYARYKQLATHVENKTIPPADYQKVWSPEKVEQRKLLDEISKNAYEAWQKGKENIGDWQCQKYCPYSDLCWDRKGNPRDVESTVAATTKNPR